jgi:small subunit ribosomal protein S16
MRLARGGRKKVPFYHIVAADSRRARDGRYIERLGYYNPLAREGEIKFHMKEDRVDYWFGVGAQASDALAKLMVKEGKGPQKIRDEFTKRLERRIEIVKKREEAKAKADATAKAQEAAAAEESAAPVEEEAKAAEAPTAQNTEAEESGETEAQATGQDGAKKAAAEESAAPVEETKAAAAPAEEAPAEETPAKDEKTAG